MWQDIIDKFLIEKKKLAVTEVVTVPEEASLRECLHLEFVLENGMEICVDCGLIGKRFFHCNQVNGTSKFRRKNTVCAIYSEMPVYFSPDVKNLTVEIYKSVTNDKIYRSVFRRAIIAACLHRASIILGKPIFFEDLLVIFKLKTHDANRGICFVASHIPDASFYIPFVSDDIGTDSLLEALNIHPHHKFNIAQVYLFAKMCGVVAQSHIKSAVCGCIWFYLKLTASKITLKQFVKICGLSPLTVQKKYIDLKRSAVRGVMKRFFSSMLTLAKRQTKHFQENSTDTLRSMVDKLTIVNYSDANSISVIADDGFVYPLNDVDDVTEWNSLISGKTYTDEHSNKITLKVLLIESRRGIDLDFSQTSEPLRSMGPNLLIKEIYSLLNIKYNPTNQLMDVENEE